MNSNIPLIKEEKPNFIYLTILYSLYFLIAPFEDMLNFGAGTILFYIAILIVIVTFSYFYFYNLNIKLFDFRVVAPIVLIIISWISILWSSNISVTFSRNITYTLLPMLFVISSITYFSNKSFEIIKKAIITGGLGIFIFILINFDEFLSQEYQRFTIAEGNDPNNLAAHLIFPLFLAISYIFDKMDKKRIINYFYIAALLFSIFMTGSRGAFLAVIVGLISLLFFFNKKPFFSKLLFTSTFIILILIIINIIPESIYQRIFRLENYTRDFDSYGSRTSIWIIMVTKIIPNILPLGLGSGMVPYELLHYFGQIKATHNTYLTIIGEYGFIGFPIFAIFIVKMLNKLKKYNPIILSGLVAMLVVIFFLDSYPKKFFWNCLILASLYINTKNRNYELVFKVDEFNLRRY
jgi:O-antigen ligase